MEQITPDRATRMLEQNTANRKIRPRHVISLAEQMDEGHWRSDLAPPILIGVNGVVIDGQHRLRAIELAGVTIDCEIRYVNETSAIGLPIDIGALRSPGDLLQADARVAQVVRLAASIGECKNAKISPSMLVEYNNFIGPPVTRLNTEHGGIVGRVSTAGIRLGICLVHMGCFGSDLGKVAFHEYNAMKRHAPETAKLQSTRALYKRIMNAKNPGGGAVRAVVETYLTLRAFERPDATSVIATNMVTMREKVRDVIVLMKDRYQVMSR